MDRLDPRSAGRPLDPERELHGWIAGRFVNDGPHGVAQGLVNLLDDLVDNDLRGLLAEGWAKEIRYLAALLDRMNLSELSDPTTGAALLFDALNGAMLRSATRSDPSLQPASSPTSWRDGHDLNPRVDWNYEQQRAPVGTRSSPASTTS